MDRVALFWIIFFEKQNTLRQNFTNFPGKHEYIQTNCIRKSIRIINSLYANIPAESPSYAPTFFFFDVRGNQMYVLTFVIHDANSVAIRKSQISLFHCLLYFDVCADHLG